MAEWKPSRLKGVAVGMAMVFSVLALDGLSLFHLTHSLITLLSFFEGLLVALSLPILATLGYWLYGLFNLRYLLDRNGLVIVWAATRQIIPMSNITRVVRGETVGQVTNGLPIMHDSNKTLTGETIRQVRMQGINWPGYHITYGQIEGLGPVFSYSTCPLKDQLLLVTSTFTYGISPSDPDGFLADFELRRRLGPIRPLRQRSVQARFVTLPFWSDRIAHLLLALGSAANAALFAYVCSVYPALPMLLPLRFDALGQVARIGARSEILKLPAYGLVVLLLNSMLGFWLFNRERLAAYLLFAAAILVQVLLWAATLNIVY